MPRTVICGPPLFNCTTSPTLIPSAINLLLLRPQLRAGRHPAALAWARRLILLDSGEVGDQIVDKPAVTGDEGLHPRRGGVAEDPDTVREGLKGNNLRVRNTQAF